MTGKDDNKTGSNTALFEEITRDFVRSLQTRLTAITLKNNDEHSFNITFLKDSDGVLSINGGHVHLTLRRPQSMDDIPYLRGQADHFGLKLNHHNKIIHNQLRPDGTPKDGIDSIAYFYDFLEDIRSDALGSEHMQGVAKNTHLYFEETMRNTIHKLGPECSGSIKEALAYRILLRESLIGGDVCADLLSFAAPFMVGLTPIIEKHKNALLKSMNDQNAYGREVLNLLQDLFPDNDIKQPAHNHNDPNDNDHGNEEAKEEEQDSSARGEDDTNDDEQEQQETSESSMETMSEQTEGMERIDANQFSDSDTAQNDEGSGASSGPDANKGKNNFDSYTVYTDDYDEVIQADKLCDETERHKLYEHLKVNSQDMRTEVRQIGQKLRRFLKAQQNTTWHFDQEEGMLDTARLSRIIMNPTTPLSFKTEKENPFFDTVVSILVDNSGSMRGRPIFTAASCTDILAGVLEQCDVKTEILGFTTRAWKGGKSYQKWLSDGKPPKPGRLNDLRHIIYKSADKPLRRCKTNFGVMIKEGLLKENIDGEALLWAYSRLLKRPEKRKIMIVISDGSPIDDATDSQNKNGLLVNHLRDVITNIEGDSRIELSAIGIGHDVTKHYEKSVKIDTVDTLARTLADRLLLLFANEKDPQGKRLIKRLKMNMK